MTVVKASGASRLLTLVFTDLVDSTGLKSRLGDRTAGALIERHQELVRGLVTQPGTQQKRGVFPDCRRIEQILLESARAQASKSSG